MGSVMHHFSLRNEINGLAGEIVENRGKPWNKTESGPKPRNHGFIYKIKP